MIKLKLDLNINISNSIGEKLWRLYADNGYKYRANDEPGFRAYVAAIIPGADVTGTAAEGLTLKFKDERVYTMFVLRYA